MPRTAGGHDALSDSSAARGASPDLALGSRATGDGSASCVRADCVVERFSGWDRIGEGVPINTLYRRPPVRRMTRIVRGQMVVESCKTGTRVFMVPRIDVRYRRSAVRVLSISMFAK
ncbi:MAG TPA: hypothetical protein VGY55_25265 [Pirellulales bacterium]|jgi:hypothetical protein|nr:hypothetical protein [Pirellulales bacterium]